MTETDTIRLDQFNHVLSGRADVGIIDDLIRFLQARRAAYADHAPYYPLTIGYKAPPIGRIEITLVPDLVEMLTDGNYIIAPAYRIEVKDGQEIGPKEITEFSIIPHHSYDTGEK